MANEEIKKNSKEENEELNDTVIEDSYDEDDEEFSPEDQAIIDEILQGYRDELNELYERRHQRAIERANMTEEELERSILEDLEAVAADVGGADVIYDVDDEDYEGMSDEEIEELLNSIQGIGSLLTLDENGTLQDQADYVVEQINKKKNKKDEE